MANDTIPFRLLERAQVHGEDPAYFVKSEGRWQETSWASYAAEIERVAKALMAAGLEPGQNVALFGFNRPEWSIFMLAAMMVGARGVGIYTTSSPHEVKYILGHAEARFALVDTEARFQIVRQASAALPHLRQVVTMRAAPAISDALAVPWNNFRERGNAVPTAAVRARAGALTPESVATIVYTSGSEGIPEGVMLSQRNLIWTAEVVRDVLRIGPQDSSLSYLPLSHVSEQMFTVHGPIVTGSSVYYAESMRDAPRNLREVQPTMVFGVPRIWEKLQEGMEARLRAAHGARARLLAWARALASDVVRARAEGKEPPLELGLKYELAESLVLAKIKRALGLANARLCLIGAAPIGHDTLAFFASLGVQLLELYGQSESSGPITLNQPSRTRLGKVGPKLPGTSLKIAEDGEILVSGPNVFVGYYRDDEATNRALAGGYLHTGDLGELDAEGFLTVTGRKREIIVTAGGKNVAPARVEAAIQREELVRDVMVVGERRRFLSALITVDERAARRLGLGEPLTDNAIVRQRIEERIAEVNRELTTVEQIKRYTILPRPFGIETGELTPTLKLRRRQIEELWAKEIDTMYADAPVRPHADRP